MGQIRAGVSVWPVVTHEIDPLTQRPRLVAVVP